MLWNLSCHGVDLAGKYQAIRTNLLNHLLHHLPKRQLPMTYAMKRRLMMNFNLKKRQRKTSAELMASQMAEHLIPLIKINLKEGKEENETLSFFKSLTLMLKSYPPEESINKKHQ